MNLLLSYVNTYDASVYHNFLIYIFPIFLCITCYFPLSHVYFRGKVLLNLSFVRQAKPQSVSQSSLLTIVEVKATIIYLFKSHYIHKLFKTCSNITRVYDFHSLYSTV